MIRKEEFIKTISSKLVLLEQKRKKHLGKMIGVEFILCIVAVFFFYIYWVCGDSYAILSNISFCAFAIIAYIFISNPIIENKNFRRLIKKDCLKYILEAFNLSFERTKFCKNIIENSNLFSKCTDIVYDDIICGEYNGVKILVAEVDISYVQKGRKSDTVFKIFKGIIMSFDFNKNIYANTIVVPRGDKKILNVMPAPVINIVTYIMAFLIFSVGGIFLLFTKSGIIYFVFGLLFVLLALCFLKFSISIIKDIITQRKIYKGVYFEDVIFDKRYKVYSKDQVEARYLITPSFMERFKNLKTAFGRGKTKCSFVGKEIVFAIQSKKDLFELCSLYTKLGKDKQIENFYNELKSIYDIIDYFKLNEHIGL